VLPVELAGREEEEVPDVLGGVEEAERGLEPEVVGSGVLIGREFAPWICWETASENFPLMPVNLNFAENDKAAN